MMMMTMSCAAKSILKSSPVVLNGCISSEPSIFTTRVTPLHVCLVSKPIKFSLSSSYSPSSLRSLFSLRRKSQVPTVFAVVSAQQEEDNRVVLDKGDVGVEQESLDWKEEEIDGPEASVSDWEEEGGLGVIGDAGEVESGGEDGVFEAEGGEEYAEPPEEAKLFVGNIPYDVDSEKLARVFEQAGTVEVAEVIYSRETDQSRGFGFVTMSTIEEAEKAVEMLHRSELDGRLLVVNKAAPKGSRPERPLRVFEPSYRIYVGNLPWDVDDARLEQLFSEHGKVVSARVVQERDTGRSRGFGFVTMSSEAGLNDAIANLDGKTLGGRAIRVNIAEERPRRSNF